MRPSQRIFLNTAATYARAVLGAGLALFSIRWVLNALGQIDFGIFSVVGSLIPFITFMNSVMSWSVSRYFAYYIGQGKSAEINRWFNTAFSIHLLLSIALTLIGWFVGEYIIKHIFSVPIDRIPACLWVFRITLISAFVSMVSVPFIALFTAKQHLAEVAIWGILYSLAAFSLAWQLSYVSGDRLMFYATGMVVILVLVQFAQVFRASYIFPECRIDYRQWFNRQRFKEIFSFSIWNALGSMGTMLRNNGSAILLNHFFGPRVNAAFGIANQVSGQTDMFASSMIGAFAPEITASEGRGDRARMISLSNLASKFSTILVILFAIPLMAEIDYVLKLWLIEPPAYTAIFCQLILLIFIIDRLSVGYLLAVNAYGKIAAFHVTNGIILSMTLLVAWLFLKAGFSPTSVGVAFVITSIASTLGRVLWARKLFSLSIRHWVKVVVMPCTKVAFAATIGALVPHFLLPISCYRLVLVISTSLAASLLTTWFFTFDMSDRNFVRQNFVHMITKIRG
ncbi:MAG: hypothetical protein APR62_06485 [Smithella sp. SDB]|nr:MAG: hypothetical protein APR62_06485 [Smithella sp. SDB]